MEYKPSDLFIGAIEFFGILVPGAALLFLHGDLLLNCIHLNFGSDSLGKSAAFLAASYVIGQFLLGIGVPLNHALEIYQRPADDPFYVEVKGSIPLPAKLQKSRTNAFYRAYSFVRLKSPAALAEIERQMADYKLFRSLTLVFALDLVLVWVHGGSGWSRLTFSGLLCILAAWRFCFLLGWTYRITFEFYTLLTDTAAAPEKRL
jgi:hypothetical protein